MSANVATVEFAAPDDRGPVVLRRPSADVPAHAWVAETRSPTDGIVTTHGDDVPGNAFNGDGSPIEPEILEHVRDAYEQEKRSSPGSAAKSWCWTISCSPTVAAHSRDRARSPWRCPDPARPHRIPFSQSNRRHCIAEHATPPVVNSPNRWDPLVEVIVGSVANGARPGFEPALRPYFPDPSDHGFEAARCGEDELKAAQEQLNTLADVLRQEGAVVRRPAPMDFFTDVRTSTFQVRSQNSSTCPQDVLLVVGDEIIEASMAMRNRFFEYLPYRPLVTEYFNAGARWAAAAKARHGRRDVRRRLLGRGRRLRRRRQSGPERRGTLLRRGKLRPARPGHLLPTPHRDERLRSPVVWSVISVPNTASTACGSRTGTRSTSTP